MNAEPRREFYIVQPMPEPQYVIVCPRCPHESAARTEGLAIRELIRHVVQVHCEPVMKEQA